MKTLLILLLSISSLLSAQDSLYLAANEERSLPQLLANQFFLTPNCVGELLQQDTFFVTIAVVVEYGRIAHYYTTQCNVGDCANLVIYPDWDDANALLKTKTTLALQKHHLLTLHLAVKNRCIYRPEKNLTWTEIEGYDKKKARLERRKKKKNTDSSD